MLINSQLVLNLAFVVRPTVFFNTYCIQLKVMDAGVSASLMYVSPISHPQDVPVLHVACQAGFGSGQQPTSDIVNLYISPVIGGKQQ